MSIKARRMHGGDVNPTLIIEVSGWHDIYRFAHHLTSGQCEFADIGFKVLGRMKRRLGKDRWAWTQRYMHGDGGYR